MACFPPSVVDALRRRPGLTDVRSAGTTAVAPASPQSHIPTFPADAILTEPEQAVTFVRNRITEGSDYIKIVVDEPALSPETVRALTVAVHQRGVRDEGVAQGRRVELYCVGSALNRLGGEAYVLCGGGELSVPHDHRAAAGRLLGDDLHRPQDLGVGHLRALPRGGAGGPEADVPAEHPLNVLAKGAFVEAPVTVERGQPFA